MTTLACSQCKASLTCNVDDIDTCWCNELPAILPLDNTTTSCLCRVCTLAKINQFLSTLYLRPLKEQLTFAKSFQTNANLIEHLDYEMQNNYMVFSRWFFLKRGKCCKNNCKNCPYKNV
ncbi:hypothetical protein H5154_11160 [Pseudoalteromonas sp. SR44-5]|uniref:DUF5522 domain-containing protein n=1 Tax=Pseudoalteromonas TaxID=53246 RepID=UPI0015FED295|nr:MULTISPECIES: DUF5522 domain-containing protein [unclassified Pseudoalteromonas]MBB1366937.1 hypothetical protein [Pseudoalteromonas sp. SR44-5]MBB1467667.1 hypothetical protein [Pseudoalteromonas sp. SG41-5]